jgi:hypothetical protein
VLQKDLIEVDIRIAKLRNQMALGKSNLEAKKELDQLIDQRGALIKAIALSKNRATEDKPV